MKRNPKGLIFYKGASLIDGSPIVVVGTFKTANEKTGNMVQTWIIRSDMSPMEAVRSGDDSAICGACPHRHHSGGACYVVPFHAPRAVYESYTKGKYKEYDPSKHDAILAGKKIRFGAYGDPSAVPFEVWENLANKSLGHTGYTHHLGANHFDERLLDLCMVSVETPQQAKKANAMGAKTFRVKTDDTPMMAFEIECANESSGISCQDCMLCDGQKMSIAINAHGVRAKRFTNKFEQIIVKQIN